MGWVYVCVCVLEMSCILCFITLDFVCLKSNYPGLFWHWPRRMYWPDGDHIAWQALTQGYILHGGGWGDGGACSDQNWPPWLLISSLETSQDPPPPSPPPTTHSFWLDGKGGWRGRSHQQTAINVVVDTHSLWWWRCGKWAANGN